MAMDLSDQRRSTNVEDLRDWGPYLQNLLFGKTMNRMDPQYTSGPNEAMLRLMSGKEYGSPMAKEAGFWDLDKIDPTSREYMPFVLDDERNR